MAGQILYPDFRQASQIPQPGIRPAEVLDAPRPACRAKEDGAFGSAADGLVEQFLQFFPDGDATQQTCLPGRFVLLDCGRSPDRATRCRPQVSHWRHKHGDTVFN